MKPAHLGLLNAHGVFENKRKSIDECFAYKTVSNRPGSIEYLSMEEADRRSQDLVDNLGRGNPIVACGYVIPFDSLGNIGLLIGRNDLQSMKKYLRSYEIDQIYWYNYETRQRIYGIEGLIAGDDMVNIDFSNIEGGVEQVRKEMSEGPIKHNICKLIGGKDEEDKQDRVLTLEDVMSNPEHMDAYKKITRKEFKEETIFNNISNMLALGKMVEIKKEMTKVSYTFAAMMDQKYMSDEKQVLDPECISLQKFSRDESKQNPTGIYCPLDTGLKIINYTAAQKINHTGKKFTTKESSVMRARENLNHASRHREEIAITLGIKIKAA